MALTRAAPFLPRIEGAELWRLVEDKAFDLAEMRAVLGLAPMPLQEGLRTMDFTDTPRSERRLSAPPAA